MAANQQQQGIARNIVLYPEAVIPQTGSRHFPWGPLVVGLLAVVTAGIALAWSLGIMDVRQTPEPLIIDTSPPPPPPEASKRSPYPAELPDLSGQRALAATALLPSVAKPEPTAEPIVAVAPPLPPSLPKPGVEKVKTGALPPVVTGQRVAALARTPATPKPLPHSVASSTRPVPSSPRPVARTTVIQRPAQPVGSLAGLFLPSDYPAAARRNGDQGDVTVRLAIRGDGRVSGCQILASDASASLKSATCAILIQRARFVPATDADRPATDSAFIQHISWRLP